MEQSQKTVNFRYRRRRFHLIYHCTDATENWQMARYSNIKRNNFMCHKAVCCLVDLSCCLCQMYRFLLSVVAVLVLTATICDVVWQFRSQPIVSNGSILPTAVVADNQHGETADENGRLRTVPSENTPLLTTTSVQTRQSACCHEAKQESNSKSLNCTNLPYLI
jgi:hypothetical protein